MSWKISLLGPNQACSQITPIGSGPNFRRGNSYICTRLVNSMKHSNCDPIPTWLLKECSSVIIPLFTIHQHHQCLLFRVSWFQFLSSEIHFNTDQLSNYCPISNRSLILKIIKHYIKSRLTDHISSNNFLNTHQSSCLLKTPFHWNCFLIYPLSCD